MKIVRCFASIPGMRGPIIFILAATCAANAFAQTGEFLAPAEAVKIIIDGRPWSAVTAEGRGGTMTLKRDGSGTFEGPFTLTVSWEVKGQDVCLNLKIVLKCLRFRQIAGGYAGYEGSKLDLTLSRSGPRS